MDPSPTTDAERAAYLSFRERHGALAEQVPNDLLRKRVSRTFKRLCQDLAPTLSLELGAHEASFSKWLKRRVPTARCLAFEANPYVYEKYVDKVTAAGVEYVPKAVASSNGTVELTIPTYVWKRAREVTNRMASLGQHRHTKDAQVVTVESVRLDDEVAPGADDVVVAWIDVEGASGVVLPASREVLARTSLVYIEVESEPVWTGQWLDVDVAAFFAGLGLVPLMRDAQRPGQYNVVFASAAMATEPEVARAVAAVYDPA